MQKNKSKQKQTKTKNRIKKTRKYNKKNKQDMKFNYFIIFLISTGIASCLVIDFIISSNITTYETKDILILLFFSCLMHILSFLGFAFISKLFFAK